MISSDKTNKTSRRKENLIYLNPILWTDFCLARVPCRLIRSWLLGSGSISSLKETLNQNMLLMKNVHIDTGNIELIFELLEKNMYPLRLRGYKGIAEMIFNVVKNGVTSVRLVHIL